jgi:hypothetical protein
MRTRFNSSRVLTILALSLTAVFLMSADGIADSPKGLNSQAKKELSDAGVDKYLGEFTPASSTPWAQDWTKHTFDTADGDGPTCIAGTPYSMFTKAGNPEKLLIFLQGGGACWENFPSCTITAEDQFPPPAAFLPGIFSESSQDGSIPNDIGSWSVVYLPYCDGSVFGGDNDVMTEPTFGTGTRRHRGLRNLSAGMDVAAAEFGTKLEKVLVAGSSAGGVGTAAFAPFLARFLYGNNVELFVFNDAGPLALDPEGRPDAADARAADWDFAKFYPESCTECDPAGQQTEIVQWRLDNDSTIREAFYETDGDVTNRGFASTNEPGDPVGFLTQSDYRAILDAEHGALNAAHPDRYKRFIVSGGALPLGVVFSHTALQSNSRFYGLLANGVPLYQWTNDFVKPPGNRSVWNDIVEDFVQFPPAP